MDVHVDPRRIHLQEDESQRVTSLRDQRVVALREREGHRTAVDRTTVDDRDEVLTRAAADARLAEQPTETHAGSFEERHQRDLFGHLTAPDLTDAVQQGRVTRRAEDLAAVFAQQETDFRVGDGVEADEADDVRGLGLVGLQELQPGRDRVEKIRHLDARARRHAVITTMDELAAVDRDLRA